jgi:hypothetical protein
MVMMQFDREKMQAVILRTCQKCPKDQLGAVKLNKVLYYLDMVHYANFRRSVTGATYRKRPNGPTTDQLLFVLEDMQREAKLKVSSVEYYGYIKKEYQPLVSEPNGVLNAVEQSILDEVIDFVCFSNTAQSISDYSHAAPWELSDMGEVIPYHRALLLFPMQPSSEAFSATEHDGDCLEAARSLSNTVDLPLLADFRARILEMRQ